MIAFLNFLISGDSYRGVVMGHEICGVITELGKSVSDVTSLKVGDAVIVMPWRGCTQCEACTTGHSNLCANNHSGTTDLGQGPHGGGFGNFVAVPEIELCVKLPACIPPEIGCQLPCSALTVYNAIMTSRGTLERAARIRGVSNLLVIGCGGLAFWVIVLLKHVLCNRTVKVICADRHKDKLDQAAQHGADDVILWSDSDDVDTKVQSTTLSGFNLIDVCFDFVGSPATFEVALQCMNNGGSILPIGLAGGCVTLPLPLFSAKAVSIQGVRTGNLPMLKELTDLLAIQHLQSYPPVEVHPLEDINQVLERMKRGELKGRAVIKHHQDTH